MIFHIRPKSFISALFTVLMTGGLLFLLVMTACAQEEENDNQTTSSFEEEQAQDEFRDSLLDHEPEWFKSPQAHMIAENILLFQRASGGWPKNIILNRPLTAADKKKLADYTNEPFATIDNGATFTEMRFLAQIHAVSKNQDYVLAFLKGLDYLLEAQYPNGGWPQFYPLRKGYYSHITFNDDAMIGVLRLIRDIAGSRPGYGVVDNDRRNRARLALYNGIECILKTQIKIDNQLTAWCAQYDEKTLLPAKARNYELISLSGDETVNIIRFLMEIDNPSQQIVTAIQSAVKWLDDVKLTGMRVIRQPDPASPTGFNKLVIADPDAPPLWARFYLIGSNKPFFSDRDGKIYYDLTQISSERRNNYGWLGYWPEDVLNRYYPQWHKKWAPDCNVLAH